jgi:hypothetical protein
MTEDGRSLASLVADEAPVPVRRAVAVMLAVALAAQRAQASGTAVGAVSSEDVTVHADGSVDLATTETSSSAPMWSSEAVASAAPGPGGAAIGRLLFELLVGRAPLGREDAFEPAITEALPAEACALMARSCSDAVAQWPSVDDWVRSLEGVAGGQAAPLPPAVVSRDRTRRALLAAGVVALAAASIGSVLMAPTWWDHVNDTPTHQGG